MSVLFCSACNEEHDYHQWAGRGTPTKWYCGKHIAIGPIEVTTDEIRRERITHAPDMIQRYRGGELSREFTKLHPEVTKGMVKEGVITQKQVDNARNVWSKDVPGLSHL